MLQKNIIDILSERGFIDAITDEALRNAANSPLKVYSGFDPTADSLHLGSMVPLMGLAWFQRCGHTPVAIVGGATGMIGDPSGKSAERQLLDEPAIKKNIVGVTKNILSVLTDKGNIYITDNGNYIADVAFENECFPERDHALISAIPGVLETGFFLNLAGRVFVGHPDGHVDLIQ